MQTNLRVGIIGCGGVGVRHAAAWRQNHATVTAISDLHRPVAEELAKQFPEAVIFDDSAEMLHSGIVDAVSICTPPSEHEASAIGALRQDIHVLCEKPLSHTLESGVRIREAALNSRALLMPAFRHRFLPVMKRIRGLLEEGAIGPVVVFNNVFCGPAFEMRDRWFSKRAIAGGGTMMDTSSHSVDLFRFLCGEVVQQCAITHRVLEGIDVEDTNLLSVKSQSGAIGSLVASWVTGAGSDVIDLLGQKGRLTYDYSQPAKISLIQGEHSEIIEVQPSSGFAEEIGHFLCAIRGEEALQCTLNDGFRALEVIQNAYTNQ